MHRKIAAFMGMLVLLAWLFMRYPLNGAEPVNDPQDGVAIAAESPVIRTAYEPPSPEPEAKTEAVAAAEDVVPDTLHWIDVPLISQLPELYNGCEITSLAMLLAYLQQPVDKLDLAAMLPKDETSPEFDEDGNISVWGDPDIGFVGDIYGNELGYAVYVKPLAQVLEQVYAPGAQDLTGQDFSEIERAVTDGKPVVIWNIASFEQSDDWTTWKTPEGKEVSATFQEHCVLLIGFDDESVYVNNPFENIQGQKVPKSSFIEAWEQMGRMALTYQS